ncbi:MAG: hypothetical protein KGR26_16655, partial [Cyanobacteria bacterium REEB65]|nr:hypothetical protein [Cyanobacteria bacterium REEB65]
NLEQQNAIKALYDRLEEMKAAKPGESDEIRRLREESDRRDREVREKEFRDELRRSEERTAALISELRNAANNNQPNMFAEAMKESARLSAETARETARVQAEATKENARVMQEAMRAMGPGQLLDVIKVARDQSGTFDLVKNITSAFGGMMDVQVTATKAALENLGAGQPSLGAQLAGEAINTVRGGIEKIVEMKGATSIQEERRKEMEARAAVETARAASIRAETERQMTTHLREAPAAPLGDPNAAGTAKVLRMVPTPTPEPETPPTATAPPPAIPVVDATRLLYPEEVETLGTEPQIHEAIRRLRVGTLDYLRATPEEQKAGQKVTGEPILTPDRATSAIL